MKAISRPVRLALVFLSLTSWGANTHAETKIQPVSVAATVATKFAQYGHPGAWLIKPDQAAATVLYGEALTERRLPPASTFKVLLALIALETSALKSVTEIVPWDGKNYPNQPLWQADMALKAAMQSSNESYFKVLAGRIGHTQLASWVARVGYGNALIGADVRKVWVDGVLTVTAGEQLAFIDRLQRGDLPFKSAHLDAVKSVLLDSEVNGYRIYGKTGTHFNDAKLPGTGWWIGWIDAPGTASGTSFVLQVELQTIDGRDKRIALGKELLRATGTLK
jgi:beta-lactamase class D